MRSCMRCPSIFIRASIRWAKISWKRALRTGAWNVTFSARARPQHSTAFKPESPVLEHIGMVVKRTLVEVHLSVLCEHQHRGRAGAITGRTDECCGKPALPVQGDSSTW